MYTRAKLLYGLQTDYIYIRSEWKDFTEIKKEKITNRLTQRRQHKT